MCWPRVKSRLSEKKSLISRFAVGQLLIVDDIASAQKHKQILKTNCYLPSIKKLQKPLVWNIFSNKTVLRVIRRRQ